LYRSANAAAAAAAHDADTDTASKHVNLAPLGFPRRAAPLLRFFPLPPRGMNFATCVTCARAPSSPSSTPFFLLRRHRVNGCIHACFVLRLRALHARAARSRRGSFVFVVFAPSSCRAPPHRSQRAAKDGGKSSSRRESFAFGAPTTQFVLPTLPPPPPPHLHHHACPSRPAVDAIADQHRMTHSPRRSPSNARKRTKRTSKKQLHLGREKSPLCLWCSGAGVKELRKAKVPRAIRKSRGQLKKVPQGHPWG
jgi:hypothetical protein